MPKIRRKNKTKKQIAKEPSTEDGRAEKRNLRLLRVASEKPLSSGLFSDKYRLPHEVEDHWHLRRMFIERNYHNLPEDELECLAQVFMNIELLHCHYPPETMKRVAELSEGITTEYRCRRSTMLQRTFVSASSAAASKVQRKALNLAINEASSSFALEPRFPPKTLEDALCNIVVINNCFEATVRAFRNLNTGWNIEGSVQTDRRGKATAYVKVGGFQLAQIVGKASDDPKSLLKKAKKDAIKYLTEHCYTLLTKKQPTEIEGLSVISKTNVESNEKRDGVADPLGEITSLNTSNVGFKLMQKLGWKGGGLGVRGEGITDPVKVEMKIGRQGLGITNESLCPSEILKELNALRNGNLRHHLIFSTEFSKSDRKTIHEMAYKLHLKTRSFGSERQGTRQIVVFAKIIHPREILKKVLIEKDTYYCEMYEVVCPTK